MSTDQLRLEETDLFTTGQNGTDISPSFDMDIDSVSIDVHFGSFKGPGLQSESASSIFLVQVLEFTGLRFTL